MNELIIARQEFANKLAELINDSGLPAFVMAELVQNAHRGLTQLANIQLNQALERGNDNGECISDDEDNVQGQCGHGNRREDERNPGQDN